MSLLYCQFAHELLLANREQGIKINSYRKKASTIKSLWNQNILDLLSPMQHVKKTLQLAPLPNSYKDRMEQNLFFYINLIEEVRESSPADANGRGF